MNGQANMLWKQPEGINGLTPNRSKNISQQVPLSQFSSNPNQQGTNIPPQARMSTNNPMSTKTNQLISGNIGKGVKKYQL